MVPGADFPFIMRAVLLLLLLLDLVHLSRRVADVGVARSVDILEDEEQDSIDGWVSSISDTYRVRIRGR